MLIDSGLLPEDFTARHREDCAAGRERWWRKRMKQYAATGKRMLFVVLELGRINFRQRLNPESGAKLPLWSDVAYFFFHSFTVQLLVALYYQYVFDYHHYYLARFDQMAELCQDKNATKPPMKDMEEFRRRLVDDRESARYAAKVIGAPYLHGNYALPIFYMLIVTLGPLEYIVPQFYKNLDTSVVRYLIESPEEAQRSIDAVIRDRVNSFIVSSRLYSQVSVQRDAPCEGRREFCSKKNEEHYRQTCPAPDTSECNARSKARRHRLLWEHKFLVEQAKFMAYEGMLQPFDRRKEWQEMGNMYLAAYIFMAPFTLLGLLAYSKLMPMLMQFKVETDLMDWVFRVEIFVYIAIPLEMSVVWNLFGLVMCVDQAHTISKLCNLFDGCLRDNTLILINLARAPRLDQTDVCLSRLGQESSSMAVAASNWTSINRAGTPTRERAPFDLIAERINTSLLYTFLHYKIFVKQLRMHIKMMALWASIALVLATAPALVLRILAVYLSRRDKAILAVTSACFFAEINIGLVLICWLHKRCLDVYKRLQSLMAHVIESEQIVKAKYDQACYNEHLVELLRRELSHPERIIDRFSAKIALPNFNITYKNLLRYDFWYGAWTILSLAVDYTRPNAKEIFGRAWRFYSRTDRDLGEFFSNCTQSRY